MTVAPFLFRLICDRGGQCAETFQQYVNGLLILRDRILASQSETEAFSEVV